MSVTRSRAARALVSCLLLLATTSCDGSPSSTVATDVTDAHVDAGPDVSGPSDGGDDAGDVSDASTSDAGTIDAGRRDAGTVVEPPDPVIPDGPVAFVRFAHLAFGVGDVHLCVSVSAGNALTTHVVLTALSATSTDHFVPRPLDYPAITSGDNIVPLSILDPDPGRTATIEMWRAGDLDTTDASLGRGTLARCVPKDSSVTPLATRVLGASDAGLYVSGIHFTILGTGRLAVPASSDCLAANDVTPVSCPTVAIQLLDDRVTHPSVGTAVRIVNASTRHAVEGSCTATVTNISSFSTGATTPVLASGAAPAMLPRVGSRASDDFHSSFVVGPNLALGSVTIPPSTAVSTARLFGRPHAVGATFACPTRIFASRPSGTPTTNDVVANGSIPQSSAIRSRFDGTPYEGDSVDDSGTHDGDAVSIFLVDGDVGSASTPGDVPTAILIRE